MKSLLAVVFSASLAATSLYAMGSGPSAPAPSGQGQPASFGDDGMLHRPTPKPEASPAASNPKTKQPLTVSLGKDNTGKENLTTFASSDPKIYLVWKAETGTKGEKVHTAWYAVDTGGAISKNKKLTENTQTIPGTGSVSASSYIEKPAGGFPAGTYRVDVSDDGKLVKSLKFTVKK